jgi:hypothetical protein
MATPLAARLAAPSLTPTTPLPTIIDLTEEAETPAPCRENRAEPKRFGGSMSSSRRDDMPTEPKRAGPSTPPTIIDLTEEPMTSAPETKECRGNRAEPELQARYGGRMTASNARSTVVESKRTLRRRREMENRARAGATGQIGGEGASSSRWF